MSCPHPTVVPGPSAVRHLTLPLLRALAEPSPAGVPEAWLRGFWLTGEPELRLYLQPAGRPAEAGPVAVDLAREADPVAVRRAVSASHRYTALLGAALHGPPPSRRRLTLTGHAWRP